MIKDLVQRTLDEVLYPKGIYVYEQRKSGQDADEYVVYSLSGDSGEGFADNKELVKNANVTIRYYYRAEKLNNYSTRKKVREIEDLIENTLKEAGLTTPFGRLDAGDIDDIGYFTTVFECEYWRVV